MATLNIENNPQKQTVSFDNSILILGPADTNYKNLEIEYYEDISIVESIYGKNSDLTIAFKEAKEIGAPKVFLCNCYYFNDYVQFLDEITVEFDYICPLFFFSDFCKTNFKKKVYLAQLYSNIISNNSHIFLTEKHASLFSDIEHFEKNMKEIYNSFNNTILPASINGENLNFVLNNLQKYKFANVILASIIVQNSLKEYPTKDVGEVVFDINNSDFFGKDIIYFSYNDISKTTVENFYNLRCVNDYEKYMPIHLVLTKIRKSLNLDEYRGSYLTSYTRIQIEKRIVEILNSFIGNTIEYYTLDNIAYEATKSHEIIITVYLTVKPFNSIEDFSFSLEV